MGLIHTLGAGTDAGSSWLRAFMLATAIPAAALLAARLRQSALNRASGNRARARPAAPPS